MLERPPLDRAKLSKVRRRLFQDPPTNEDITIKQDLPIDQDLPNNQDVQANQEHNEEQNNIIQLPEVDEHFILSSEEARKKWNFDFVNECPEDGDWIWERVDRETEHSKNLEETERSQRKL